MTTATAPYGVTVNVYLPLLTLSLGYVQVQGLWQEVGRIQSRRFKKGDRPPRTSWQKLTPPPPPAWKMEKPSFSSPYTLQKKVYPAE